MLDIDRHVKHALHMKSSLRDLRAKAELSQADLAEVLGVSRQTINAIETEKYSPYMAHLKLRGDIGWVKERGWKKSLAMHAKGFHQRPIIELRHHVDLDAVLREPVIDLGAQHAAMGREQHRSAVETFRKVPAELGHERGTAENGDRAFSQQMRADLLWPTLSVRAIRKHKVEAMQQQRRQEFFEATFDAFDFDLKITV